MLTSNKGVAPIEVQRAIGLRSYRSAWFLCRRIRAGLTDNNFRNIMGIAEVDKAPNHS
jgi:hypothetical protein